MAPPSSRRPGSSRRLQYGLFAGYVVAIVGMFGGLLLALTARFDPQGHAAIQGAFADMTSPLSNATRTAASGVVAGIDGVGAYIDAGSKNRSMQAEVRNNRTRLIEAQATVRENYRLKRLLHLVETQHGVAVASRLIASTGASTRRYATLGAGSLAGIASGEPVRTSEGLVGRIVAVGRFTARVLLITDGGNVVPVRRVGDGMPALATGRGDGALDIRALEAGSNPFRVGDVFVTSGAGGVYRPNVPVAVTKAITRELALARPFADPNRLDFALVEPVYIPADAALPRPEGNP